MKKRTSSFNVLLAVLAISVVALACGGQAGSDTPEAGSPPTTSAPAEGPPRPFLLGFTPFPYDISAEAVDYVYGRLAEDADIIAHHFDNGVPWPEALAGAGDLARSLRASLSANTIGRLYKARRVG